jgi:UDP-3-O-[3-hydroxymyristoyl] glucosamine N-acyltransferase
VPLSLAELAHRTGATLRGDGAVAVARVATLESAEPGAIAFLANPKYRPLLASTRASAVIVAPEMTGDTALPGLVDPNPYAIFAKVAALLHPRATVAPAWIRLRSSIRPRASRRLRRLPPWPSSVRAPSSANAPASARAR